MYNEIDDPSSEYEITINKLSNHIEELFSKIHYYQALVAEKEIQIKHLIKENQNLIVKVQKLTQKSISPPEPSQESYTPPRLPSSEQYVAPPTPPPIPPKQPASSFSINEDPRINKRQCPNCGALGFAIKEVDDKTKVISYTPRRMYAKKKSCTKCRYEWS